jgi:ATP-dependent DNA ligase
MGIYYGQGKRSQFIAAYLVGTYENEKLYPVSKVGTGFTDEKLEQYTKIFE